ncbi:DapH/DapD/GlmU-related protein [Enterococcus casseliflavus]|uniref:DapH/DapD/GlmU-related protein n=1 Tax=Enterococcus casseliflavus TaxID=37734 RepID=UPI001883E04B|nr:DapH/DapD/GlmU-related protein [Enterococcus casseliflavus]MBE9906802.1 UDP-3-O-(3-hydroxymyristoyl)glucosamine N-acyltransferase [Enterococcus casseliflavus]
MKLNKLKAYGRIYGDPESEFSVLAPCKSNIKQNFLTYYSDEKFQNDILINEWISVVICKEKDLDCFSKRKDLSFLIVDNPKLTFFIIHNEFNRMKNTMLNNENNISSSAIIHPNVEIGYNVTIRENVIIYSNTKIGNNCFIGAGSIIGSSGFQFVNANDSYLYVEHYGKTLIEDDVKIMNYVTIDKPVFEWDSTIVGNNSIIDSKTHISHGVKIGKKVLIGSCCSISGNTIIENDCYIGPNSTIANRILIGEKSRVSLGSVVTKDVNINESVSGNFAIPHWKFMENLKKSIK